MNEARQLLVRAFNVLKKRDYVTEYEEKLEKEISYYLLSNPEQTQNEPVDISDTHKPKNSARLPNGAVASNVDEAYEAGLKEGRSAPTQDQDDEAVAWGMPDSVGNIVDTITEYDMEGEMAEWSHQYPVPLFRHPAPRLEFVRLSGEDIRELWSKAEDAFVFARDVEILSREKNNE